ncbi:conjugal transfer protein TraD [Komagataeibacter oboediens]|uniref:conjugal transfer protein TraD n=1 Tax=Komagataeibacter oboediens TaxID=65958 RepID=UPI0026A28224
MRRPRDIDSELKALQEKAKQLKVQRTIQLGELVEATGADTLNCPGFCGDGTTREVRRIHEHQIEAFSA